MSFLVKNGSFFYKKGQPILSNVQFEVGEGEVLAILGPNGAGKTTLLRCMTGILKWKSGASFLDEEDISAMKMKKLWRKMAYVPQAREASCAYTALEMVLLGRSSHHNAFEIPKQEDVTRAMEVLKFLKIDHLADQKCSKVSGGELQMILIAKALASEPKVLVLDEPESNLDFKNQLLVLDVISELAKKGMTCIFNTHYPAHALQRAQKALVLSKGGTYLFGNVNEVITEKTIRDIFGVEAWIGEFSAPTGTAKSVIPLGITPERGE